MADPSFNDTFLGVKLATLVAGFAGGIVSLSFVKQLTPLAGILAVFTGMVAAGYGTPALLYYVSLPAEMQYFSAFVIGLTAMNLIPAILKVSEILRNDPLAFFDRFRTGGGK